MRIEVTSDGQVDLPTELLEKHGLVAGSDVLRYCLALAKREAARVLTAERRWPQIAEAAGVSVEVIR